MLLLPVTCLLVALIALQAAVEAGAPSVPEASKESPGPTKGRRPHYAKLIDWYEVTEWGQERPGRRRTHTTHETQPASAGIQRGPEGLKTLWNAGRSFVLRPAFCLLTRWYSFERMTP